MLASNFLNFLIGSLTNAVLTTVRSHPEAKQRRKRTFEGQQCYATASIHVIPFSSFVAFYVFMHDGRFRYSDCSRYSILGDQCLLYGVLDGGSAEVTTKFVCLLCLLSSFCDFLNVRNAVIATTQRSVKHDLVDHIVVKHEHSPSCSTHPIIQ